MFSAWIVVAVAACLVIAVKVASLFSDREESRGAHSFISLVFFLAAFFATQKLISPKVDVWIASRQVETQLGANPFFIGLKKYQPATYQQIVARIKDAIAHGEKMDTAIASVQATTTKTLIKNLPAATNHAAYNFLQVFQHQLVELKQSGGGDTCYNFLFPDASTVASSLQIMDQKVSASSKDAMNNALLEVLESSSTAPQRAPRDDEGMPALQKLGSELAAQYGPDVQVILHPQAPGVDKTKVCTIITDMYGRVLALPPEQAGMMMRFLAAKSQGGGAA